MKKRMNAKINYWIGYAKFVGEFFAFRDRSRKSGREFVPRWSERRALLNYKTPDTKVDRHYVFHTAWAARVLAQTRPVYHVDISSTLYFGAMVSAFVPIKFYDYRPAQMDLKGLECGKEDLLHLSFPDSTVASISCMHTLEHVGLGRYGDTMDPNGDINGINEIKRVTKKGGDILCVVPVGKPNIIFNAHRIYSYEQIIKYFDGCELKEFALIPDDAKDGNLVYGATKEMVAQQTYGCGCFWFKKK